MSALTDQPHKSIVGERVCPQAAHWLTHKSETRCYYPGHPLLLLLLLLPLLEMLVMLWTSPLLTKN